MNGPTKHNNFDLRTTSLTVLVALLWTAAGALAGDVGSTSLNFLKVGVGARPAAMGSAFSALSDDVALAVTAEAPNEELNDLREAILRA